MSANQYSSSVFPYRFDDFRLQERLKHDPKRIRHPDPPRSVVEDFDPPLPPGWWQFEAEFSSHGLVDVILELRFEDGSSDLKRLPVIKRNHTGAIYRLPLGLSGLTWHCEGSGDLDSPLTMQMKPYQLLPKKGGFLKKLQSLAQISSSRALKKIAQKTKSTSDIQNYLPLSETVANNSADYNAWQSVFDEHPNDHRERHNIRLKRLYRRSTLSVLAYITDKTEAAELAQHMGGQIHPGWELVLIAKADLVDILFFTDARIHVVATHGKTRAHALNDGLQHASGSFVMSLPPGAKLRNHALLDTALALQADPMIRLLYADEDKISSDGEREHPSFKPAWSPEQMVCCDYLGDPVWYHAETLRATGGWRPGTFPFEDHDLKLRFTEKVGASSILHLAKLHLHKLTDKHSLDPRAHIPVIAHHLARTGSSGRIIYDQQFNAPRIIRSRTEDQPFASILIPSLNKADVLDLCIRAIRNKTKYPAFEILIIDQDIQDQALQKLFQSWQNISYIKVIRPSVDPCNVASLYNEAARHAHGEVLVLFNPHIEVLSEDWLTEMASHVLQPGIGCVGSKFSSAESFQSTQTFHHLQNVSMLTGSFAVKTSTYNAIGGLNESISPPHLYITDFCLKILAAGCRHILTPFAKLQDHSLSASDDGSSELFQIKAQWGLRLLHDPYAPLYLHLTHHN